MRRVKDGAEFRYDGSRRPKRGCRHSPRTTDHREKSSLQKNEASGRPPDFVTERSSLNKGKKCFFSWHHVVAECPVAVSEVDENQTQLRASTDVSNVIPQSCEEIDVPAWSDVFNGGRHSGSGKEQDSAKQTSFETQRLALLLTPEDETRRDDAPLQHTLPFPDEISPDSNQPSPSPETSEVHEPEESRTDSGPSLSLLCRENPLLYGCRRVDLYKKLNKISEGTYGAVYRAQNRETGEIVALKHIKYHEKVWEEGFPLTSLREISILMELHHENIVNVQEVVVGANPNQVFMVMEYVEHELKMLLDQDRPPFSLSERKALVYQLLEAVAFMHEHWVIHRDLKTSNLLYSNNGTLKVCDFGMARKFGDPIKTYTQNIVTLWYRAPELLLGATEYTESVDLWSAGCIMAEIFLRRPLFDGRNEAEALDKIFKLCGTPTETSWPGFQTLPAVAQHRVEVPRHGSTWRTTFPVPKSHLTDTAALTDHGLHLLQSLIALDPEKRLPAKQALDHPFFKEKPLPQRRHLMPSAPETNTKVHDPRRPSEMDVKNRSFFHDHTSRFGVRVDPQRYLSELENASRALKQKLSTERCR